MALCFFYKLSLREKSGGYSFFLELWSRDQQPITRSDNLRSPASNKSRSSDLTMTLQSRDMLPAPSFNEARWPRPNPSVNLSVRLSHGKSSMRQIRWCSSDGALNACFLCCHLPAAMAVAASTTSATPCSNYTCVCVWPSMDRHHDSFLGPPN